VGRRRVPVHGRVNARPLLRRPKPSVWPTMTSVDSPRFTPLPHLLALAVVDRICYHGCYHRAVLTLAMMA
jgi:hypothetical protein